MLIFYFYRFKMNQEQLVQIQNEIEIMKLVDHPNIVKAEAFAQDEKYIYIVTEFMEGGDVRSPKINNLCFVQLYSFMVARGTGIS